ncbi:MAG TPA: chorismate-binding protein, partial [Acidimicrobiales bacterium]
MTGTAPTRSWTPGTTTAGGSDALARRVQLPVGEVIDPFALAGAHGILVADAGRILVGVGTATELPLTGGLADAGGLDRALARLAALACDDRVPAGTTALRPVVAFGALPFDRHEPAVLLVPSTLYCREPDGTEWATVVAAPDGTGIDETPAGLRDRLVATAASHGIARPSDSTGPVTARVTPRSTDAAFEGSVATVVDAIARDQVTKVVLARWVDVTLDRSPDLGALLRRWASLEPNGTLFSLPAGDGQFIGASPELLVERHGVHVRSRPLAGTTDRFPDAASPLPLELLESAKDGEEHRLVVDAIHELLAPWCTTLVVPDGPELVHLHNLTHLGTTIGGTLATDAGRSAPSALHLAALL